MRDSLIDTNVLVYAYDQTEKGKHEKARETMRSAWTGENYLSIQNLCEFYSAATEKIRAPLDKELARQIVIDLSSGFGVFAYGKEEVFEAAHIQRIHSIHFWDALLAATMQAHGISRVVTENEKDFGKIKWLEVINPFRR